MGMYCQEHVDWRSLQEGGRYSFDAEEKVSISWAITKNEYAGEEHGSPLVHFDLRITMRVNAQ